MRSWRSPFSIIRLTNQTEPDWPSQGQGRALQLPPRPFLAKDRARLKGFEALIIKWNYFNRISECGRSSPGNVPAFFGTNGSHEQGASPPRNAPQNQRESRERICLFSKVLQRFPGCITHSAPAQPRWRRPMTGICQPTRFPPCYTGRKTGFDLTRSVASNLAPEPGGDS